MSEKVNPSKMPRHSFVTKALIIDDHALFRLGLRHLLSQLWSGIEILEASDYESGCQSIKEKKYDLILSDYLLPGGNGLQLLELAKSHQSQAILILLTNIQDTSVLYNAIKLGIRGCLFKSMDTKDLESHLKAIQDGETIFPELSLPITASLFDSRENPFVKLTDREVELVRLVVSGLKQKDIAERMSISLRTVEKHRSNINQKLGTINTSELVRMAYTWGVVSDSGLVSSWK